MDSFVIHVCVEGNYVIECHGKQHTVKMGECILLPRTSERIDMITVNGFKILESYVEL